MQQHSYKQKINCINISTTVGQLYFEGYKFCECTKRKYFHESTLVSSLQFAIHVTIEFLLIFGETNFVEVPKIHEICEICSPQKRCPKVLANYRW